MNLRRLTVLAALFISPLAFECGGPVESRVYDGPLRVQAISPELRLSNTTGEPIYFKVIEQRTATLIDWMPCVDLATCEAVQVGETKRVPYSAIYGYESGRTEAIVYWWQLAAKAGGGYSVKSLTSIPIRL